MLVFSITAAHAQVKPASKAPQKKQVRTKKTVLQDSLTPVTNRRDTVKIEIPKDNSFNPSSPKLKNSKIKTPLYNNQVTGTAAPGDVNTGIPPSPNSISAATQATKDSTH